ncbi:hypothetical protein BD324DRAFT_652063 [Kockovaella imperatae]|uniref:Nucleoporin Nup159/Nup146 N-terminal domain-containing protein n=1 Tax=Kockovaella imperatae TaxID=4999 RepID=A0A1Y1UF73_9TREE|nr:hypothetical protein BD324DRAFT_652063 [Kockovaella imperatae]ORX36164.1 hypothetical protein BD324DRAFT_652063 [Kockovaella imperatae]
MLDSNSFGALDMDQNAEAGPSRRRMDGDEVDADWLRLVKTNHDVYVRVSDKVDVGSLPQECNLMAISNLYDLLIVGSNTDIRIHRLSDVHKLLEDTPKDASPTSTPAYTVPLPSRPIWIRLAMREERLIVGLEGRGVQMFRLSDIVGGNTTPYHTFSDGLPNHLLDILPNPAPSNEELSHHVAFLSSNSLIFGNLETCRQASPINGPFSAASWSAKGKQIVVGTSEARLVQYTPDGTPKAEIPPPPELEEGFQAVFIQWLENDLFFVGYANPSGQLDDPLDIYIIHRQRSTFFFTKFFDPNDVLGLQGRSSLYRHFASLKAWGSDTKHLAFMISGLASEIGVMRGRDSEQPSEPPQWELLILDETSRGVMPAAKAGRDDTSVLGLALDLTTSKPIIRGIQGGIELPELPPPPRVIAYSQEGFIVSFNVQYESAGSYPGMLKPSQLPSQTRTSETPDTTMDTGIDTLDALAENPELPEASGLSGFGASSFGSAFGSTSQSDGVPTGTSASDQSTKASSPFSQFGSSAFGQTTTPSGTPAKPPPVQAFGQSGFGAFATSTTPTGSSSSTFGQSAFVSASSTTPAKSPATAFGQPAFGQSAFGQSTTPSGTPAKTTSSAFGQTALAGSSDGSVRPTFGQSTFGQTSSNASPAFGPISSSSAFGQSAFGQAPKPAFGSSPFSASAPHSDSVPSAFGQTTSPSPSSSAFGQAALSTSAFGKSAFGPVASTSAFGQASGPSSSSPSAFGSSSFGKPATTQSPQTGSSPAAFGSSSFGQSASLGPSSTFGQSTFGQSGKPNPFGQSAFGQSSGSSGSAFGAIPSSSSSLGFGAFSNSKSGTVFGFGAKPSDHAGSSGVSSTPQASPFGGGSSASAFGSAGAFGSGPSPFTTPAPAVFGGHQDPGQPTRSGTVTKSEPTPEPEPVVKSDPSPPLPVSPVRSPTTSSLSPKPEPVEDDFGFGGFASALSTNTSVPGLADSPPSSPKGQSGKPPGLEDDDSPPASPQDTTDRPAVLASAAPTSSFIKPATAFAGATSSGFGAFGAQTKSTGAVNAFSSSSSSGPASAPPSAFGTSSLGKPSAPSTGSAFGQSAFGKPSVPSAGPAFGQSAFGKPSMPTAVGQQSASTQSAFGSPAASGAITGGFGAFASKSTEKNDGKPVFGGFGGFASAATGGKSAFAVSGGTGRSSSSIFGPSTSESPAVKLKEERKNPESTDTPSLKAVPGPSRLASDSESGSEASSDEAATSPQQAAAGELPVGTSEALPREEVSTIDGTLSNREKSDAIDAKSDQDGVAGALSDEDADEEGFDEDDYDEDEVDYEDEDEDEEEYDEEEEEEEEEEEYDEEDEPADEEVEDDEVARNGGSETSDDAAAQGTHLRRHSSSVEPDLPSIVEEEEGPEEEAEEESATRKSPKSPPPWFTKPSADASSANSLFSRIGPTPNQPLFGSNQKNLGSFGLKHAARTSSPLGTNPPSVPSIHETSTPPESPAAVAAPNIVDQRKPGSGLGLGRPGAQPVAAATTTSAPFSFGDLGKSTATIATPLPSAAPPPVPKEFTISSRVPHKRPTPSRSTGQKTMSAVLERMILEMSDDIDSVKDMLQSNKDYHAKFDIPGFAKLSLANISEHKAIPFTSLKDMPAIVSDISAQLRHGTESNQLASEKMAELQSQMLKSDMKTGQVDRYLDARKDPDLVARNKAGDPSPDQAAITLKLESSISEIESQMRRLRKSLDRLHDRPSTEDRARARNESLGELRRSYQKVELAIRDQLDNVDDLADRIAQIKFTTPPRFHTPEKASPGPLARRSRTSMTPSLHVQEYHIPEAIMREMKQDERSRAEWNVILDRIKEVPLIDMYELQGRRRPINMDDLPEPGTYVAEIKAEPSAATSSVDHPPPAAPSFSGFGGISFSLDAGVPASVARSGHSGRGGAGGSRRSHASAPKLHSSGTAPTLGDSSASLFGSFNPPPTDQPKGKDAPSGFVSFSGFGK